MKKKHSKVTGFSNISGEAKIHMFHVKVYLCTLGEYCTSNFLLQFCLIRIWKTLTKLWTVGEHCLYCAGNHFVHC